MKDFRSNCIGKTKLEKPYVAVMVKRVGNKLIVCEKDGLKICKPDTKIGKLSSKIKVYCKNEQIKADNNFYITMETIDPYHMVLDKE